MSVQTNLMQLTANFSATKFSDVININAICRLCTNHSEKLIGIYSENGISNGLADKFNLYLPIKVSETDHLPLQCCWQCASTLLAWHDLVLTTVEADRRLRSYQFVNDKQLEEISYGAAQNIFASTTDDSLLIEDSMSRHTNSHCDTNGIELLITDCSLQVEDNLKVEQCHLATSPFVAGSDCVSTSNKEDQIDFNGQQVKVENYIKNSPYQSDSEERNVCKLDCMYCPIVFTAQSDFLRHLKETHKECKLDIDLTMKTESEQPPKKAVSEKANLKKRQERRVVRGRYMTKQPLSKLSGEEVNKAKVEVDGKVFYRCRECGKTLHSVYTYMWHTRIHTGERPYVCNLCHKYFRVSQGLIRHLKETHEQIKKFDCDICGRCFATKRSAEEHRRIHTNERPYICAKCGKSFKQKASLFVHNRSHSTEFPYTCSECPLKFRTKPVLLIHATKHTGEKPYSCDVCGRSFRIKYELKRHKLIHSEDKPFICKVCSQAFRQKRYLRNHLKLNHNITIPMNELSQ